MRIPAHWIISTVAVTLAASCWVETAPGEDKASRNGGPAEAKCIRDLLWVWGQGAGAPGPHTIATFAQASPARQAELLGVPNIVMMGSIPEPADARVREVAAAPRVVWQIAPDQSGNPPFVYTENIERVRKLVEKYPRIEHGVILDDLSTGLMSNGIRPEHLRRMRQAIEKKCPALEIWGVIYTMSFDRPNLDAYIKELDVLNLWTWHAKDTVNLEKNVAHCEQKYPHKPIVLGLYMYDYGGERKILMQLLKQQCETALKLAHAGRIRGIIFLSTADDAEPIGWTADWIKRVGGQKIGSPAGAPKRGRS
jgi:hypothetical protein